MERVGLPAGGLRVRRGRVAAGEPEGGTRFQTGAMQRSLAQQGVTGMIICGRRHRTAATRSAMTHARQRLPERSMGVCQ